MTVRATANVTVFLVGLVVGCAAEEPDDDLVSPDGKADGAGACTASKAKIETSARALMKAEGLIGTGDEMAGAFSSRWGLARVTAHGDTCLAVMEPCYFDGDELVACEPSMIEVIAYTVAGDDVETTLFEDAIALPSSLRVGIGNVFPDYDEQGAQIPGLTPDLYYAELAGDSVSAAMKSVVATAHYCGFGGLVIPGGKATFDPTPDRTWRVVDGFFSLRRGNSHEVGDIRPAHWDGEFDAYFSGAVPMQTTVDGKQVTGAQILPWGACFMRRYEVEGRWVDVLKQPVL